MNVEIPSPPKNQRTGLVIVNTGNGKGKTTAALGTAFRALGWGWKVSVIQFVKGRWITGEKNLADKFSLPIDIHPMGDGFTWKTDNAQKDIETCEKIWSFIEKVIDGEEHDLIILDEINIVFDKKYLDVNRVIEKLKKRPSWMHVIMTGRGAPAGLIEYADLVSDIKEVKHPFTSGLKAQKGVDF
jgi:cob(I)alamin adenosyltransferase